MKRDPLRVQSVGQQGQAMVEFAIMLLVFMILISGQVYLARVVTFQFWTQQEARFLAFEQTDVARTGYSGSPTAESEDYYDGHRNEFRRPELVDSLIHNGSVSESEGIRDLLLSQNRPTSTRQDEPLDKLRFLTDSSTYFAANDSSGSERSHDGALSFISNAWASRRQSELDQDTGGVINDPKIRRALIRNTRPESETEQRFVAVMRKSGIGEDFCAAAAGRAAAKNFAGVHQLFASQGCAQWINDGFAIDLARTADIRGGYRDYGERIESGFTPQDALVETVRDMTARGFYSFFDQKVRQSANDAETTIMIDRAVTDVSLATDSQFQELLTELRYVGSIVAEAAVAVSLGVISTMSTSNRNPDTELDFANDLNTVLHADAKATAGGLGYMLGPDYLPLTSLMLEPMYGGIVNGLLENVLSKDDSLKDYFVERSNKEAHSSLQIGNGMWGAMARRFRKNATVKSDFYLVTEPWHIPRRVSPDGSYRQIGNENDNYNDDDSDEAILKRRVVGLWLVPSNPIALLEPVLDLVDGSGSLGSLFEGGGALSLFGDSIEFFTDGAKDFICDNPLNDIMGFLDSLPGFGASKDSTFPSCPAVRPAVYAHTKEISNDKLAGPDESRDFEDYVKEQRESNPRPRPKFHDDSDTATNKGGQSDQGAKSCNWTD